MLAIYVGNKLIVEKVDFEKNQTFLLFGTWLVSPKLRSAKKLRKICLLFVKIIGFITNTAGAGELLERGLAVFIAQTAFFVYFLLKEKAQMMQFIGTGCRCTSFFL